MEKKNKRKFGENKEKVAKKEERLMVLVSTAQSEAMKKTHQEESEISHWIVAAIYQSKLPKLVGDDFLYCFLTVSKKYFIRRLSFNLYSIRLCFLCFWLCFLYELNYLLANFEVLSKFKTANLFNLINGLWRLVLNIESFGFEYSQCITF